MLMVLRQRKSVYNNIKKFIQFQLTMNVAALALTFLHLFIYFSGKVPLTAVQPLCVNLIMDTMRAIALATELPNNDSMVKPSVGRSKPFVTKVIAV